MSARQKTTATRNASAAALAPLPAVEPDHSSCATRSDICQADGDPLRDADHTRPAPLSGSVSVAPINDAGQFYLDARPSDAGVDLSPDGGRISHDDPTRLAAVALCAEIREHYRARQDFLNAERRMTLQIKAMCRRICQGDVGEAGKLYKALTQNKEHEHKFIAEGILRPMLDARQPLTAEKKRREKILAQLGKDLPIASFVDDVSGLSVLGLAYIIGEAGPLSNYSNPAKLWKRMGLAVINGQRQRRVAGAEAIEHGYSAERRALMYVIGEAMVRRENRYRTLRDERKQFEREKAAANGLTVAPSAKIPVGEKDRYMSDGHVNNRANRYVQKRLLKDLWRAWRAAT